jgi:hypothetical protein
MSDYVRVPKSFVLMYWHEPWSAVVAAAETRTDGVTFAAPPWTPDRENEPQRRNYAEGTAGDDLHRRDLATWRDSRDVAYLYQGDVRSWGPDKTLLFQQNW